MAPHKAIIYQPWSSPRSPEFTAESCHLLIPTTGPLGQLYWANTQSCFNRTSNLFQATFRPAPRTNCPLFNIFSFCLSTLPLVFSSFLFVCFRRNTENAVLHSTETKPTAGNGTLNYFNKIIFIVFLPRNKLKISCVQIHNIFWHL